MTSFFNCTLNYNLNEFIYNPYNPEMFSLY